MLDDLRDLYQDLILDHGKRPRNFHTLPAATHEALGHNPLCGDRLVLQLKLDAQGKVQEVGFQGSGCAISMASASMMTEMLKGRTATEAETLFSYFHALCTGAAPPDQDVTEDDFERLQALAGVRHYPMRVKCATLAWHTLHSALHPEQGEKAKTE
jgi:nitrogen fixation NifU-like protein